MDISNLHTMNLHHKLPLITNQLAYFHTMRTILRHYFQVKKFKVLEFWILHLLGGGGTPIPLDAAALGPSNICRCCCSWASSVCTRSTSKITGRARIMKEVPAIQSVWPVKLYNHFAPLKVYPVIEDAALHKPSGNISDNPTILSSTVSLTSSRF